VVRRRVRVLYVERKKSFGALSDNNDLFPCPIYHMEVCNSYVIPNVDWYVLVLKLLTFQ
jgi:hypothetical protein